MRHGARRVRNGFVSTAGQNAARELGNAERQHILAEVPGSDRKPVAGRSFVEASPIVGDQASATVNWKGNEDLRHPENSPIFLRFRLDRAQIFSLEFV